MNRDNEYYRLSSEILQDQRIRITLFTFSITTSAAIIGLSSKIISPAQENLAIGLLVIVFAIYAVLIPCIILVYHYTRGINCKSEYLRIAHGERWMVDFDTLTEELIPASPELTKTHRLMVILGAYSTEKAFTIAYFLLNILIVMFALIRANTDKYPYFYVYVGFFLITLLIMKVFRPISKRQYRQVWQMSLKNQHSDNN